MEPRTFKREELAVGCLIGATAVLCVVGSLSQFLDLGREGEALANVVLVLAFAGLCGFSLWVANIAAACAQILAKHRKQKPWAFGIALLTAALTGLVSVIGVDLAWMTLTGKQQVYPDTEYVVAAGFALGFVKVAMGFVIEACKQIVSGETNAHDELLESRQRRIDELEAELRRARSQSQKPFAANDEAPPQTAPVRTSGANSRALANALSRSPVRRSQRPAMEIRERAERGPPLTMDELQAAIAEMTEQGKVIDFSKVAKHVGVPYSRVERSPGRHLIEAIAKAA